jgi:hypothetical protein
VGARNILIGRSRNRSGKPKNTKNNRKAAGRQKVATKVTSRGSRDITKTGISSKT